MMGFTLLFMVAIWLLGAFFKIDFGKRLTLVLLVYLAALMAHAVLPEGAPPRLIVGGSLKSWLLVGNAALLVIVYFWFVGKLRVKANRKADAMSDNAPKPTFSETELNRYARHIIMHEIGGAGQKKLKNARVLVIGAGGLGSPVLLYLAAAGIGTIGVIDDDVVDNSNLQRQVIHNDADIGMPKVFSAEKAMKAQNPFITVRPYERRLDEDNAAAIFAEYDLVLDGTDNFNTRYLVNRTCVAQKIPLVAGALTQWEGQISIYDPANGAPCYQCVFPEAPATGLAPSCAEAGVIGPLPGVIGSMMAVEAIKVITGAGADLRGAMLIYDGLYGDMRRITVKPRKDCPVCGG